MCLLRGTDWIFIYRQFNISNSTFCPHSVFMCFVWIWEQTAIISLYNINLLVFITETECVYCAVRTGYFNIIQVIIFISRVHLPAMLVSRVTTVQRLRRQNWTHHVGYLLPLVYEQPLLTSTSTGVPASTDKIYIFIYLEATTSKLITVTALTHSLP